jgi:hypothetical protein
MVEKKRIMNHAHSTSLPSLIVIPLDHHRQQVVMVADHSMI